MKNSDTLSEFYLPLRVGLLALCALHPLSLLPLMLPPLTLRLSLSPPLVLSLTLTYFTPVLAYTYTRVSLDSLFSREIGLSLSHDFVAEPRSPEFPSGFHAATRHITMSRRTASRGTTTRTRSHARITSSPTTYFRAHVRSSFSLFSRFVGG